ncbi:UNKNOWN [Stylonychia lemnae]|uniref:CHAT domain-containing protein n=1 Tax=Stylonychia lemnae TaxID=5949 RepID=A0A078AGI6_STYLE|nr:UNKNOWN [Stylonychia lemnae]|eukprot:CDW81385.1 UNKNOWN [Stylonychia lemnae]
MTHNYHSLDKNESKHLNIIFKYCFEVERVARRDDSYSLNVQPLIITEDGSAVFTRDAIINSLEQESINRINIQALKYYDERIRSWTEIPNEISIRTDQGHQSVNQSPQIVEMLIREGPQRDSSRTSLHANIQNLGSLGIIAPVRESRAQSIKDPTKVEELEKEIQMLKEKMSNLESKFETHFILNDFNSIRSRDISIQNIDGQKPPALDHPRVSDDFQYLTEQMNQPALTQRQSQHEYMCHQCHSEIIKDTRKINSHRQNKANSTKDAGKNKHHEHQRQKSHKIDKQESAKSYSQRVNSTDGTSNVSKDENEYEESEYSEDSNDRYHDQSELSFQNYSYNRHNDSGISPNQGKNTKQNGNYSHQKKKLDLAYLYSDPLVYRDKDKLWPMDSPLDTEIEFREIYKILSQRKKVFTIRKDAVNFENLKQILAAQPSIIHISCHGDYDLTLKQYYLAFEEKDSGILDQLTEERLGSLLGDGSNHKVELVFVSACHSEKIGKIFQRAKIPVVVAVNSHTMILDEVCQLFARHFYFHLQGGFTPRKAFQEAQKVVKGSKIDKFSCCCAHDHKPYCKWENYAKKHGYEKAHQLHMPTCSCNKQNIHKDNCNFYTNFHSVLSEYEDLIHMTVDEFDSPQMGDKVKLCCCHSDIPHDESIKFIINGQDEYLDKEFFQKRKDGVLQIEQDVNQMNKLEHDIDTQMLIGRNRELQIIVSHLFSDSPKCRLIHIYGQEGLGKSAIANYAAKYTLDRRKFQDGVYFLEIQNRNSGQGLISKICQKLIISTCNKEQLCDIIKSSHILIIIDKCQKILEQGKDQLNKTLKYLVKNTMFAKFAVITYNKGDIIEKYRFKVQVEITELSIFDAAKLLLTAAGNCKSLALYKDDPRKLSKHKIFQMISYKPVGILQMVPLVQAKDLDSIVKDIEEQKNQQSLTKSYTEEPKQSMEFGEFSWIMNISYRDLQAKFQNEIQLLYIMCQFPAGLFQGDIETICQQYQYGDWKKFLEVISQDGKTLLSQTLDKNTLKTKIKNSFRMVISNYNEDLQEHHYIAQPIVLEYINKLVLTKEIQTYNFLESFKYLAKLSRKLLRSIKFQKKNEIDLYCVSSEIDLGIWKDNLTNFPLSEQELEQNMVFNPEIKFNIYEANLIGFLDAPLLKCHFQKLDYKTPFSQYLDELSINIPSILIMMERLEEAKLCIQKTKEIVNIFDLKFIKAKSLMVQSSIMLRQHCKYHDVVLLLDQAEKIFLDLEFYDGAADAMFLKSVSLILSINQKFNQYDDNEESFVRAQQHHQGHFMERSNSYETRIDGGLGSLKLNIDRGNMSNIHTPSNSNNTETNSSKSIKYEIEGVLSHLQNSRKFYKKASLEYGIAKVNLIEAEFQIEKSYGSGLPIEYNPRKLIMLLIDAIQIFKKFRYDCLHVRCLRNLALLKYRQDDWYDAKQHIEDGLNIARKIQDTHQEALCSEILNQVLDKIRIHSNNVFIFAKAFPLVEVLSSKTVRVVGTFTRYPQDFRKRIFSEVKKLNKVVNLKFDILSLELLNYVKNYGCRVLHISSDVYSPDHLCIEGKNAEIQYIKIAELKNLLDPLESGLNVDLVVLAIPESQKLAQAFVEMGVPHVVSFDFKPNFLSNFMYNVYTLPKRYDYIYDFCVEFYKNLILEKTILESWRKAKPSINDGIRKVSNQMQNFSLSQDDIGQGPILHPSDYKHRDKLFDGQSFDDKMLLKSGQFLDTSKIRGPTNIQINKPSTPYTGRQIDTNKLIGNLKKQKIKIVNIVGLDGIGKTRFVQETAYYLSTRYEFQDGIFILDLRRVKTTEQIKLKLKELNIGGSQNQELNTDLQKKNILLIFDNIDTILKHNKTSFDWFLISLVQSTEQLKLILTSKKEIKSKDYQCLEKSIMIHKLKPLNDIEAVDMILSHCHRKITFEELQMTDDERQNIHQQLQHESSVKKCYGFPKYLEFFANYLSTHSFDKIDIKNYIPNSKKGQMKRLQKQFDKPQSKTSDFREGGQPQENSVQQNPKAFNQQDLNKKEGKQLALTSGYYSSSKLSKKIMHPDTIIEVEEEKEIGDSGQDGIKKKSKRQNLKDYEEEKIPREDQNHQNYHHLQNDQFFNEMMERQKDEEFFNQSRRGSNLTNNNKKLYSSSGGEDNDFGGVCFATCENKHHGSHGKFLQRGQYGNTNQNPSLFASEDQKNDKRFGQYLDAGDNQDMMRADNFFNNLNQIRIQQQPGRKSIDVRGGFGMDGFEHNQFNSESILLHIPLQKQISSSTNQINDASSDFRSRSNSDVMESQQFRRPSIQKIEKEKLDSLLQAPWAKLGINNIQDNNKLDQFDRQKFERELTHSLIDEKDEDDRTESKGTGLMDFDEEFDLIKKNNFGTEMSLAKSSIDSNENNEFSDITEPEDDLIFQQQTHSLSKQTSLFTNSSGKRSDNLSGGGYSMGNISLNRKTKSKKEQELQKEKIKARVEYGPKSGRSSKNYQKKTKNKFQEQKELNQLIKRRSKKQQDQELRQGILAKMESGQYNQSTISAVEENSQDEESLNAKTKDRGSNKKNRKDIIVRDKRKNTNESLSE